MGTKRSKFGPHFWALVDVILRGLACDLTGSRSGQCKEHAILHCENACVENSTVVETLVRVEVQTLNLKVACNLELVQAYDTVQQAVCNAFPTLGVTNFPAGAIWDKPIAPKQT